MKRIGTDVLINATGFAIIGYLASLITAMSVISVYDHGLYVRLYGPSMAIPSWKPWWGWYVLQGSLSFVGLATGAFAGWKLWSRGSKT